MIKSWLSILDRLEVPPLEKNSVLWIESIVQNFETETGIILPEGYKEFCRVFGAGIFGSYVQIFYPSLVYSQRFIGFFKDRLQSQNKSSSITSKTLENLLDSAFIFGSNANGEYFLWDLKTYCQSDRSYDIYLVPHNLEDTYLIGRTFLDFICNFCLGMKAYDILPEDLQPFPQELCYEFHRFPLPKNENETFSEEEKNRQQEDEARENIWKRNLEAGIILKLAQTYEKQGQFVKASILYIQHPLYYLGVMEKIRLYRAFRRLHEALGETLFRQVCWAASKNVTYKQLFAAMNHVWLWNAPTVIEGEQYQNFQAYHSDDRLYRASDYPKAERISVFGHEKIENLDEIFIEPIPQPDAEFLQVWQSYLQSVRTHLAESSPPDEFSSEEDIWWKNMISGALWKLARSYENQELFLETLVLYLKATHLDNFAYSEDHSERYGQFLKAIANLRDRLGDVRFCQIYRATTGYPIDVGMFEGLREDINLNIYGNSIPDSEIIDRFPDPEPEFFQIWQTFLEFVREQLAIGFSPQEYEPREREVENLYHTALDRWCLPSDRGYVEPREPADWEEKVFEEILQALRDRNCYAFFRYLRTFKNHTDSVTCVKFSPDGQILASGSADKTIKL